MSEGEEKSYAVTKGGFQAAVCLSAAERRSMHLSSILVVTDPSTTQQCARDLEALSGVEVHYLYPDSGRIIAVQETTTSEDQEAGLRRIQALERVRLAAVVEHRVDPMSDDEGLET